MKSGAAPIPESICRRGPRLDVGRQVFYLRRSPMKRPRRRDGEAGTRIVPALLCERVRAIYLSATELVPSIVCWEPPRGIRFGFGSSCLATRISSTPSR